MYKTVWHINYGDFKTEFTYYHFGKKPKFPSWYMQEEATYEIEMIWNLKLVRTPKMFFNCLLRKWREWLVH